MSGNSFGKLLTITTCGESHGPAIGVIIDGFPPRFSITAEEIQRELDRRVPGQSSITTKRKEKDRLQILSGFFEGKTTGTPILLLIANEDARSADYEELKNLYRPSHADFTYQQKYGIRDHRGGGRASARETVARVAAGALAKKYLQEKIGVEILSYVTQVGSLQAKIDPRELSYKAIEANKIRCPDPQAAAAMISLIEEVQATGDSVGGIIEGVIRNLPIGLGDPVFDKLPATLGHAMLSINAVKGFDIGSGFEAATMYGTTHNDHWNNCGKATTTNHAGGTLGGISNGETLSFRVAFKPPSTIAQPQKTITTNGIPTIMKARGRHDPCVLPRAVPVVEAMAALVIMDHYLCQRAICHD